MAYVPDRIGKYEILSLVGRGGMGQLYRARDTVLHREVAVKVMYADAVGDPHARERFYREARAVARLAHPNIVTIFEFAEDRGVPYIVMEFLEGESLADRLRSGLPLDLRQKLGILTEVCEGLHYAHQRGVVHRDVKPANIWLLPDGAVKLLDFGIARIAEATITRAGAMVGSAAYMSPEHIAGQPATARSDVFAAGVVLYELVAGRRPFDAESITAVIMQVLNETPPDIRTVVSQVPQTVAFAIDRALQKDPVNRYATAAELAADLQLALLELDEARPALEPQGRARRTRLSDAVESGVVESHAGDDDQPASVYGVEEITLAATEPTPPSRDDRRWLPVMLALAALVLVVPGYLLLTTKEPTAAKTGSAAAEPPVIFVRPIHGDVEVGISQLQTRRIGTAVVTSLKVKNLSATGTISGLKVEEHRYDRTGSPIAAGDTFRYSKPFLAGEEIDITLSAPYNPEMARNSYQFSHAHGTVTARRLDSVPAAAPQPAPAVQRAASPLRPPETAPLNLTTSRVDSTSLVRQARELARAGNYDAAADLADAAVRRDPSNAQAAALWNALRAIRRRGPASAPELIREARTLVRSGEYDIAEGLVEAPFRLAPSNVEAAELWNDIRAVRRRSSALSPPPVVEPEPPPPPPSAPVRVGGAIKPPQKVRDVRPVYPTVAQSARVQGVVVIEATIGLKGQVTGARVLRSIPLLDDAALDAVRQWEFTPTLLNGVAVPVIMTVTVQFTLQ